MVDPNDYEHEDRPGKNVNRTRFEAAHATLLLLIGVYGRNVTYELRGNTVYTLAMKP
jgi:hypothetical protein